MTSEPIIQRIRRVFEDFGELQAAYKSTEVSPEDKVEIKEAMEQLYDEIVRLEGISKLMKEKITRAIYFYERSPDGQYDHLAVWALRNALLRYKDNELLSKLYDQLRKHFGDMPAEDEGDSE